MEELYEAKDNIQISAEDNFQISPEEKRKYDTWFDGERPQAGRLSEEKVRNILVRFELADSTPDKIWELSDQDKDGFLDRYEWTVAWLLVRACTKGDVIPDKVVISSLSSLNDNTSH